MPRRREKSLIDRACMSTDAHSLVDRSSTPGMIICSKQATIIAFVVSTVPWKRNKGILVTLSSLERQSHYNVVKAPIDEIVPNAFGVPLSGEPFCCVPFCWESKGLARAPCIQICRFRQLKSKLHRKNLKAFMLLELSCDDVFNTRIRFLDGDECSC
jgi:hypothetical protein